MTQTGILEFFKRIHPVVNDTCARMKEEMSNARALTLQEVGAPFVVLAVGIPTALTFLLLELFLKRIKELSVNNFQNFSLIVSRLKNRNVRESFW